MSGHTEPGVGHTPAQHVDELVQTLGQDGAENVTARHRAELWAGVETRLGNQNKRRIPRWVLATTAGLSLGLLSWLVWPSAKLARFKPYTVLALGEVRQVALHDVAVVALQPNARAHFAASATVEATPIRHPRR